MARPIFRTSPDPGSGTTSHAPGTTLGVRVGEGGIVSAGTGEAVDELVVAARALEAGPAFPAAYAERGRAAGRRLDPPPPRPPDVPPAPAPVTQGARIDGHAPLRTPRRRA